MINVCDYRDIDGEVIITLKDNTRVICRIDSIDDEEESGLGEYGISAFTPEGGYVGIGESEIMSIRLL